MYIDNDINYFGIVTIFSCIYSQRNHGFSIMLRACIFLYTFSFTVEYSLPTILQHQNITSVLREIRFDKSLLLWTIICVFVGYCPFFDLRLRVIPLVYSYNYIMYLRRLLVFVPLIYIKIQY